MLSRASSSPSTTAPALRVSDGGPIATGTYKPTNYEGQSDEFVAPAPSGPYASALGELSGVDPNGSWSLYVTDDFFLDGGSIADGWSLTFERTVPVCCGGGPGFLVSPGEVTTTAGLGSGTRELVFRNGGDGRERRPVGDGTQRGRGGRWWEKPRR